MAAPDYVISLPNTKTKYYDSMGWILLLMHATLFIYLLLGSAESSVRFSSGTALILIVLLFIPEHLFRKKQKPVHGLKLCLIILPVFWLVILPYPLIGVVSLFLGLLYVLSKREFKVSCNQEFISYPSFPPRKISWKELNNVILKDGLLTIDFKNNKLIQQLIDETNTIDENEFNEYCKRNLKSRLDV